MAKISASNDFLAGQCGFYIFGAFGGYLVSEIVS
jgi:hypothetical protein